MSKNNISFVKHLDDDIHLIPLMGKNEESKLNKYDLPFNLSILPNRSNIVFPGVIIPISIMNKNYSEFLLESYKDNKFIGLIGSYSSADDIQISDMYNIGVVCKIMKIIKLPDDTLTLIIQGIRRFKVENIYKDNVTGKIESLVKYIPEKIPTSRNKEYSIIMELVRSSAIKILNSSPNQSMDISTSIKSIESNTILVNFLCNNISIDLKYKQRLLEISNLKNRALEIISYMQVELQKIKLRNRINNKVKKDLDKQQRDYFLNQQIKYIQEELGINDYEEEINLMKEKGNSKKWNKSIEHFFDKELSKLSSLNPQLSEYHVQKNYIDFILDLPWNKYSRTNLDINKIRKVLDDHHFGLNDIKDRIVEYISVLKLKKSIKSPIICLYGPPGVGKTSLAKSIAKALGRKYDRISLGGVTDEAEIRGHRKTYIGSMPGRILKSLKRTKVSNPLILLDEVDKIGSRLNGDPMSALLEVLDPEQNNTFHDHYLDIEYDLSKVFFIVTANNLENISEPLLDRMELIKISGYTLEDKIQICKNYIIPDQIVSNGLYKEEVNIPDKYINFIISGYTREAGVRKLSQHISKIFRKIVKLKINNEIYPNILNKDFITKILGPYIPLEKYDIKSNLPGVVIGLAWTQVGGDILYIESVISNNKKPYISMTGNIGKVMKESAEIALEYIKYNFKSLDIDYNLIKNNKVHVHVPEGATPKDGPSAGIALVCSMISVFKGIPIKKGLAMSGEITLRGKVLPVGGIKEKILAAKNANINEIILCKDNYRDVGKIENEYIKGIKFNYVENIKEVLEICFNY